METGTDKFWTTLDGNGLAPIITGPNDYSGCVVDEEELKKSLEKNRAPVASFGEEFKDLLDVRAFGGHSHRKPL